MFTFIWYCAAHSSTLLSTSQFLKVLPFDPLPSNILFQESLSGFGGKVLSHAPMILSLLPVQSIVLLSVPLIFHILPCFSNVRF